jgi:heat shock protein HslJ
MEWRTLARLAALTAAVAVVSAAAEPALAQSDQPNRDGAAADFAACMEASGFYPGGALDVGIADPATLEAAWKTCVAQTSPDGPEVGLVVPYIYDEREQTLLVGEVAIFPVMPSGAEGVLQLDDRSWCALATSGSDTMSPPSTKAVDRCLKQTTTAFQARQAVVASSALPMIERVASMPAPEPAQDSPVRLSGNAKKAAGAIVSSEPFALGGGSYRVEFFPGKRCATNAPPSTWSLIDTTTEQLVADGLASAASSIPAGEYRVDVSTFCPQGKWRVAIEPLAAPTDDIAPLAGEATGLPGIFALADEAYCAYVVPKKAKGFSNKDRRTAIDRCVARTATLAQAGLVLVPSSSTPAILALAGLASAEETPSDAESPVHATDSDVDDAPAADPAALTASAWRVIDGFPTSQELTIGFAPNGSLSGRTACFDLEGTYAIDANALIIDTSRSGSRDCSTSEFGAADSFLGALARAETWSLDGGQLTIGLPDDRYPFDLVLEPHGAD